MPAASSPSKIYHGPFNIAGIPGIIAKIERQKGLDSTSVCLPQGVYKREVDETISEFSLENAANQMWRFDVFNFHFGHTLLGESLADLRLLKALGKKVLMHFHGCDIRDSKVVLEKYHTSACQACFPMACNRNRKDAREAASKLAHRAIVYTPDLLEFVPGSVYLPQPLDVRALNDRSKKIAKIKRRKKSLRVVHAPSALDLKGSAHLIEACEQLKAEKIDIDLVLVTGRPYEEVLQEMVNADIVVDQLLIGAYGVVAIEAMSMAKPTICYIREDLVDKYPSDLPIINASPKTIKDVLAYYYANRDLLNNISESSEQYAFKYHDATVVSERLMDIYKTL